MLPSTRRCCWQAWACLAASLSAFGTAPAAPIANGDFSDPVDLAGYLDTGTFVSEPTGVFAQLATDGSFLRTLEQEFPIPAGASSLSFDFAFSTELLAPVAGFPDSFAASVITSGGDFLDLLVVDVLGVTPDPSDGIEGLTGALPISVTLDSAVSIPGFVPFPGGTSFAGRLSVEFPSSVLGLGGTLFFDLFDELDTAASIAAIDDVAVTESLVSAAEPASLGIMLAGIMVVGVRSCRRGRRAGAGTRSRAAPVT